VLLVARAATVVGSEALAPITRRELVFGVHGFYTRLALMLPRNAIAYPIATQGPTILDLLLGIATPLAALAVIAVPRRVPPELRAAAWLWLLGWLPASHAILPLQNVAVDRYLLIPSLGFALAVAYGLTRIPAGRLRTALIAIVLLAAALRTWDAQSGWRDDATLWARAVDSDPANAGAWSQYAEALDVGGDPRAALAAARDGIAAGARPVAHLRLREGLVLRELGDADGAHAAMLAAAEGGDPVAMSNVALLELAAGHTTPALAWSRRGAELDPLRAAAHRTHGKVALAAHANDEAYRAFVRAYDLEPGYLGNRYNLGLALIALGRRDEARVHLEACLADPSLADAARAALIN
jgi:tetratricopeptide (TPR) repeat protein